MSKTTSQQPWYFFISSTNLLFKTQKRYTVLLPVLRSIHIRSANVKKKKSVDFYSICVLYYLPSYTDEGSLFRHTCTSNSRSFIGLFIIIFAKNIWAHSTDTQFHRNSFIGSEAVTARQKDNQRQFTPTRTSFILRYVFHATHKHLLFLSEGSPLKNHVSWIDHFFNMLKTTKP